MELNKKNLKHYMESVIEKLDMLRGISNNIDTFNSYSNQMHRIELMIEEIEDIFD